MGYRNKKKMTKKQFRHDFLRGLGSAILELKLCSDPRQYYDIVRYGCLHNTTYDMQCEGDRSWYLYQGAHLAGGDSILHDMIARYTGSFSDSWFFGQLTGILYHYSIRGSESARSALYDKYYFLLAKLSRIGASKNWTDTIERDMFEVLCIWLTSLDGWHAFKAAIMDVSEKLLPQDGDFFFSEWFYEDSKSEFGEKRVTGFLRKQSMKNPSVQVYFNKAQEWDKLIFQPNPVPALDEVVAGIGSARRLSMRFCRNAASEDLEKLFQIAMAEPDLTRRSELLQGLRFASAPVSENMIAALLQSENKDIRETACIIMGKQPSPETRAYALSLMEKGEDIVNAIALLSPNMLPQHEQMLADAVLSVPVKFAEGEWHSAFSSAEKALSNMRGKPQTGLLLYLYRETYCSCCREYIVRLIHKKGMSTDALLQEWCYDTNPEIREYAKRILRAKGVGRK